jgi:glycosyltransferase involved in cell wall biosynthesis
MKRRLLFVIGSLDYGGAERHLVRILPGLTREWDVSVFTLSHPGAQADGLRAKGIDVRSVWVGPRPNAGLAFRVFRQASAAVALLSHLLSSRPAIIHYFLPQAYMVAAPCALLLGIPVQVMSRRSRNFYQEKHPFAARLERVLHRFMTAILGNSQAVIADLVSENVARDKLALIYNALAPEETEVVGEGTISRASLDLPENALVLIKVANLIPYKGHHDLIDALALLDKKHEWRLLCAGNDSGILAGLKEHAAAAGVADRIVWLGQRTDVGNLLQLADIGVLASHEEGFSNSILEYMAAELPVIATAVGGAAEAIEDEVTGVIVPPRNPPALAEALERLMGSPMREEMGLAGRERLVSRFSYSQCLSDYESLYRSLIAKKGIPPSLKPHR